MPKRGILIFLAVLALTAGLAIPARAQFGSLEGDVKDPEGKPLVGALVLIERTDIKGNYKVKSDKKGHFFHGGLPLGTYNMTLMVNDQKRDMVSGVRVRLGEPTVINFDLKAARDRALAQQAGIQLTPGKPGGEAPQLTKEQRSQIEQQQKQREAQREKMEKLNKNFAAGVEALKTRNFDVAIKELETAAQVDASQHVIFAHLGEAHLGAAKTMRGEEATAHFKKSQEAYQKAIALKPDDASYHNNFGLALANAGQVEEATNELTKAAQLDPPNAGRYFFNLGAVLTNTGRVKEAAEAFRKATQADPNYAEAWYQLGVSLSGDAKLDEKTGKITAAPGTVEALQKYMELQPNGPNAASAKSLIDTLGGTVQTEIKSQKARKR